MAAIGGAATAKAAARNLTGPSPYTPEPASQVLRDYLRAKADRAAARKLFLEGTGTIRHAFYPAATRFKKMPTFRRAVMLMFLGYDYQAICTDRLMTGKIHGRQYGVLSADMNQGLHAMNAAMAFIRTKFPEKTLPLARYFGFVDYYANHKCGDSAAFLLWAQFTPMHARNGVALLAGDYEWMAANTQLCLPSEAAATHQRLMPPWLLGPAFLLPPGARAAAAKDVASWKAAAEALRKHNSPEPLLHPKTPLLKYAAWVLNLRLAALKARVNRQWLAKLARMGAQQRRNETLAVWAGRLAMEEALLQKRLKALDALQVGPNSISKIGRLIGPIVGVWHQVREAKDRLGRNLSRGHGRSTLPPELRNVPNYAAIKKDFPGTDEAAVCHLFWELDFLHNWKAVRDYLAASHLNLADPRVVFLDANVKNDEGKTRQAIQELRKFLKKHPNHPSLRMLEGQLDGTWRPPPE